jgi:hypothetical protein
MKRIKTEAIECVESLSTHGLPNLSRSKYKPVKFMWLILTIGFAGLSFYFIIKSLIDYFHYNVSTEVRMIYENDLEFPSISICNKNKFSNNISIDYIKQLTRIQFNNKTFDEILDSKFENLSNLSFEIKNYFKNTEAKNLFSNIEMQNREKYTFPIRQSLQLCKFNNNDCSYLDFEWFFNQKYGNCYKFNGKGLRRTSKVNQEDGLFLEFFLGHPKEIDKLGLGKGLYISIDPPKVDTYTDFENLIEISTGLETNILIEKSLFQKYPKPYSNCDFNEETVSSLNTEEKYYYDKIVKANFLYSHSFCDVFCRHIEMSNIFTCKYKANSLEIPNVNYCNSSSFELSNRENQVYENVTNYCTKMCPKECDSTLYKSYVFTTSYSPMYIDHMKQSLNKRNRNSEENIDREDLVLLKIFYGSLSYVLYKETPSLSSFGLISTLGGILGLFLGLNH